MASVSLSRPRTFLSKIRFDCSSRSEAVDNIRLELMAMTRTKNAAAIFGAYTIAP